MNMVEARIMEILEDEVPGLTEAELGMQFEALAVDSFTLVSLRARIENAIGRPIDDKSWTRAQTPGDLIEIASGGNSGPAAAAKSEAGERRSYRLNMPQMALGGLSEPWLFKELGDLHWSMITAGLKCPSSELKDGEGNRLYATFTRFSLRLTKPLFHFRENDGLELAGKMSRYGAGVFLSETKIGGGGTANIMSSFSKRGEAGSNMSLLKGQPDIPPDCNIPSLAEPPAFAKAYRERRAAAVPPPIFECDYDIVPQHDINGVGLLYFAAYPTIADVSEMRHSGRGNAFRYSTVSRDVYYFANSDPDATLVYRLHAFREHGARLEYESSISRKADGVTMAYVLTAKHLVG